jgi:hypothetical protein
MVPSQIKYSSDSDKTNIISNTFSEILKYVFPLIVRLANLFLNPFILKASSRYLKTESKDDSIPFYPNEKLFCN